MTSRLIPANRNATARTFRRLKFTFSTPVISRWTQLQMRSPHWSGALSVHVQGFWHGRLAEPAMKKPVPNCVLDPCFQQRGKYVRQENSNREGSIAGYRCGFGRGLPGRNPARRGKNGRQHLSQVELSDNYQCTH